MKSLVKRIKRNLKRSLKNVNYAMLDNKSYCQHGRLLRFLVSNDIKYIETITSNGYVIIDIFEVCFIIETVKGFKIVKL